MVTLIEGQQIAQMYLISTALRPCTVGLYHSLFQFPASFHGFTRENIPTQAHRLWLMFDYAKKSIYVWGKAFFLVHWQMLYCGKSVSPM